MTLEELLEPNNPGECTVKKALRANNIIVKDVSDNPAYWSKDIDLIATNPATGNTVTIEVKNDTRIADTGNFFIEYKNPRSKGGNGWYRFCEADYLYYLDAQSSLLHIIKFDSLREYINANKQELRTKLTPDGAEGYLIAVDDMPIQNSLYI